MEDICRQQSPSFKKKQYQLHGDMCHLNPIQLISYQEELSLWHCQYPHCGGRDHNGFHRSHPAGLQQRSTTPTENLEIRNVHVALLQTPEDMTQKFSKLNRLIRVTAYCRRFINNCRHPKANRKPTTLSTQDLDQALTCCVKMVQHISYAQEMKDLLEHQEVSATSSLKTLHPFIDQEGFLRMGGWLQQYTLLY